ncbi:aldehyde dehydrogenase (NADP(+)) [Egibacter rhizosphaerae]|uniref:Aldehyde dehydrogenase (NADP(+)) n=1 Tax=Egibacter rhizosphaerae TaxID=1670831 RepID=A0A411YJP8_9ACTN|nr:aldehyde dehydrogenase (NADP(+)) [Egibacter rhizosphaerae]QBI21418.1 aldehyde dehydrogenase (NADP(+)) [Egibacter rhizosphaerae]
MTPPHDTETLVGGQLIAGEWIRPDGGDVQAIDPRTGEPVLPVFAEATTVEVDSAAGAAGSAAPALARWDGHRIAGLLRAIAAQLEERDEPIVARADLETALGLGRLRNELARTTAQFRMFADLVETGAHYEAIIDGPDPATTPPRPDLRRLLLPLGPVAVFGASNFPLAFSVPGGDTASALAAGCPVVAKAHPAHPGTSELCAAAIADAMRDAGAPAGTFSLVQGAGPEVGTMLVGHEAVAAVGFTGSLSAGRALHDVAASRPAPIPVYAEMGSLNPVFVTAAALAERGEEVASAFAGSMTLGTGQFCTKPGVVFVPDDEQGQAFAEAVVARLAAHDPGPLLTPRIRDSLATQLDETLQLPGVETLVEGQLPGGQAPIAGPTLLRTDFDTFLATSALAREHFGPVGLLVRVGSSRLVEAAGHMDGSLTATVHGTEGEASRLEALFEELTRRAGRVIWNGFPTGVAVTAAQHHGGPYPATTAPGHTSVGTTAVRRFQRPVAYQGTPESLLPAALRDDNPLGIPRTVDGVLTRESVESVRPFTGKGSS